MRSLLLRALFCALLLCAAAAAEETVPEPDTTLTLRPTPDAWVSDIAVPLIVDVSSKTGGMLSLVISGDEIEQSHRVRIAPGVPTRIDIPHLTAGGRLSWSLDSQSGFGYAGWSYHYGSGTPVLAVNAFLLRELELAGQKSGSGRILSSVAAEELPADWRAYAGLTAVMVMSARDAESLTPAQGAALSRWIAWWGGVLWLAGGDDDAARVLEKMGLPLARADVEERPCGKVASYLNGLVMLIPEQPDADLVHADESAPPELFDPDTVGDATELLEGLGEIPVSFIVLSLLLLGLLLGPATFVIVLRRKNPLLFFFIVPAVALLGTAAIIGGALLLEGAGGEYNQFAVLARRADGSDAMFYDMRGVRSGIVPPELRFGADTLAISFDSNDETVTLDTTEGMRLTSGWLQPRFASGYMTMRPVTSRMNIDIEGNAVTNNLGFTVKRVAVRLPGDTTAYAENIPPGGSAELVPERNSRRYMELGRRLGALTDNRVSPVTNVLLIAETDGLPYADDGGLDGTPRGAEFFYVVAGNRPAPEEKREEEEDGE